MKIDFTCKRGGTPTAVCYSISAIVDGSGYRLLIDNIKTPGIARRLLNAYETGALIAGATTSAMMPAEVRKAKVRT